MGVHSFDDLAMHVGHDVHVAQYVTFDELGEMRVANVAIECETCYEVLLDYDAPPRKKTVSVCRECGSKNVMYDAYVYVNYPEDVRTFDAVICDDCGHQGSFEKKELTEEAE